MYGAPVVLTNKAWYLACPRGPSIDGRAYCGESINSKRERDSKFRGHLICSLISLILVFVCIPASILKTKDSDLLSLPSTKRSCRSGELKQSGLSVFYGACIHTYSNRGPGLCTKSVG